MPSLKLAKSGFSTVKGDVEFSQDSDRPLAYLGETGSGKTTSAFTVAKELGIPPRQVTMPELLDPACEGGILISNFKGVHEEMLVGVDMPFDTTGKGDFVLRPAQPKEAPTEALIGDKKVLWVFDEALTYEDPVLHALRPTWYAPKGVKRYIGTHALGPNVKIMLTANGRESDTTAKREFTKPEAARLALFNWVLTVEEFLDYFSAYAASPIWQYLEFFSKGVKTDGEGVDPWKGPEGRYVGGPVCSGRSWEGVLKAYPTFASIKGDPDEFVRRASSSIPEIICKDIANLIHTVLEVGPELSAIRAGKKDISSIPKHKHPALAFAAVRVCLNEAGDDKAAAIVSGLWDWAFDLFKECSAELGAWTFSTLKAHSTPSDPEEDNPIIFHENAKQLTGLVKN